MEYYSAIKRNEIELFAVSWMDLETVIHCDFCLNFVMHLFFYLAKNKFKACCLASGLVCEEKLG